MAPVQTKEHIKNHTYIVTGDAWELPGWNPETLANALRLPLANLGVRVDHRPRQYGGGGLPNDADDELRKAVQRVVDRVAGDTK
jgi:hypothetical protein